ncbi:MAG: 50S ribosomal protein L29 [Deltaproteobacteria bacterium]|nr:50S ribosomal protein L29 [Deltaproteobacteria bacterium]
MKISEMRELDVAALKAKEKDLQETILVSRFEAAMGQLKDVKTIMKTKREIARVKTIIREKLGPESKTAVNKTAVNKG